MAYNAGVDGRAVGRPLRRALIERDDRSKER
jgi:hypothetical protein